MQTLRPALDTSTTFEQFSALLLRQGITVKESRGRLSYLTPDRTKPITARKLGDDFDRAAVLARLERNAHRVVEERAAALKNEKARSTPQQPRSVIGRLREAEKAAKQPKISTNLKRIIDIDALIEEGKSNTLIQWAKVQNLKQMAIAHNLYHEGYLSLDELDNAVETAQTAMQKSYADHKAFKPKIDEKKELREWILKYAKTRDVRNEYKAQKTDKKKAAYRAAHEEDFVIVDA